MYTILNVPEFHRYDAGDCVDLTIDVHLLFLQTKKNTILGYIVNEVGYYIDYQHERL